MRFWLQKAALNSDMHRRAAHYYVTRGQFLAVPVVLLSAVSGVGTLAANDETLTTISGVLMLLVSGLTGVQKVMGWERLSQQHREMSNAYDALIAELETELSMPVELRRDARDYVEDCKQRFALLAKTCPDIPAQIDRKYAKQLHRLQSTVLEGTPLMELNGAAPRKPATWIRSVSASTPPGAPKDEVASSSSSEEDMFEQELRMRQAKHKRRCGTFKRRSSGSSDAAEQLQQPGDDNRV